MTFSYGVSLQIRHPDADPQQIAAGIGLTPERCWAVGDARETPKGNPLLGTRTESYCVFDLGSGDDGALADLLREVLKGLEHAAAFIGELRDTGGKLNFYVFWTLGERGELFDAALLADMARLGIDLGIEPVKDKQVRY